MSKPNCLPTTGGATAVGRERRVAVRYPGNPDASCQAVVPVGDVWPAWVRDISTSGVALLIGREFAPGTVLTVELENSGEGMARALRARVVHTLEIPPEDRWLHGCAFERELSAEELRAFAE
jgi:hypothetical protein